MENCILRGRGRAVWAQNAIPFDLTASNVLVASAAPFVDSEAPLKPTPAGPVAVLQLSHVTAWLGGGLLEMHCGKAIDEKPAPFVPVEIRTDNCLFVHPESGAAPAPFALVSGGDPSQWDRYLTWTATGESVFSNFPKTGTVMMEVTSDEPAVKAKRLDIAGWLTHTMEKPTAFGPVEFARPPDNSAALAQIRPEDAVITKSDFPAPIGCRIKSLPKPRR